MLNPNLFIYFKHCQHLHLEIETETKHDVSNNSD